MTGDELAWVDGLLGEDLVERMLHGLFLMAVALLIYHAKDLGQV